MKKTLICKVLFFAACLFTLPSCSDDIDMDGSLWVSDVLTSDLGDGKTYERYFCKYFSNGYVTSYRIYRKNGSDWRSEREFQQRYAVDGNTVNYLDDPTYSPLQIHGDMFASGRVVYYRSNLHLMEVLLGRFSK